MYNTTFLSLLSTLLFVFFLIFAIGSAPVYDIDSLMEIMREIAHHDGGETTEGFNRRMERRYGEDILTTTVRDETTGAEQSRTDTPDSHGRPHGQSDMDIPLAPLVPKVTAGGNNDTLYYRVTGEYLHGRRHGWHEYLLPDGSVHDRVYYENGVISDPPDNGGSSASQRHGPVATASDVISFRILQEESPWFLFKMEAHGYETGYIEAFMAALQSRLVFYAPWSESEFTQAFIESLNDIRGNDTLFVRYYDLVIGMETFFQMRNLELRLAVIDRYLGLGTSTFEILQEHYTGFLERLLAFIAEDALKTFTDDLDERMDADGPVDLEDPAHIEIIELRMTDAIAGIYESSSHLSTLLVLYVVTSDMAYGVNPVHEALKAAYFVVSTRDGGREEAQIPERLTLGQNFPNPFNPATRIRYSIPERAQVRLTVYDAAGREVAVLVDEIKSPGYHEVAFDAAHLSSGVYLYRLSAGDFVETRRAVLVK
jgi:hypothetical protein